MIIIFIYKEPKFRNLNSKNDDSDDDISDSEAEAWSHVAGSYHGKFA